MLTEEMIPAQEFCIYHNIELSFIHALQDYDLIEVIKMKEELFVPQNQLLQLEKLVRLHYEMDINLEGIETVNHLLQKVNMLQQHILELNNRLVMYEHI
jgi:hypothetical protein